MAETVEITSPAPAAVVEVQTPSSARVVEVIAPGGPPGPQGIPGPWTHITQAEYDALSPPDPYTLYVIVG